MFSLSASPWSPVRLGCSTLAVAALLVLSASDASAQFPQLPGQGGIGGGGGNGSVGGGGRGGDAGGGGRTGGSTGGGTRGGGGGRTGGAALPSADEIFGEGVQREGAPEARGGAAGARGTGAGRMGGMRGMGGFGGFGGMGGMMGGFGGFNPFGGSQVGDPSQDSRSIRTRLTSGVNTLPPPPRAVGASVTNRLASLSGNRRFAGVNVQMEGRTAILIGQVATEEDRRMARLMVRLEPGVSEVDNRLQVAGH